MEKSKIRLISASISILTLIILFSSIAYARPITDIFGNGLLQINNFFVQEQYNAYATAIDFFFFSLLFIAIYMMGARYAFKEIKRPEQVIVILLGLMTAFLLVMGGFSATILLPYIHWLLYLLLFILLWRLLKGIKNPFWRFLLALLLTLLVIGFFAWLFNLVTTPEIGGVGQPSFGMEDFFKSFADSFKGVDFGGYVPGIPPYVRDALQLPSVPAPAPTPTGPGTLPIVPTPSQPPGKKGGIFGTGYSWWWLALMLLMAGGIWRRKDISGLFGKKKLGEEPTPTEGLTIQKIIDKIDEIIKRKKDSIKEIDKTEEEKTAIIQAQDKRIAVLAALKDRAYLWEGIRELEQGHPLKELKDKEIKLITKLKELKDIEKELLDILPRWLSFLNNQGMDITQEADYLKNLIWLKTTIQQVKDMGIIWLIVLCYDIEKREFILGKELKQLLGEDKIEDLVKGKFETVKADERKLSLYNSSEIRIIMLLEQKIKLQMTALEKLKRKISGTEPGQAPGQPPTFPSAPQQTPPETKGIFITINKPKNDPEGRKPFYLNEDIEFRAEIKNLEVPKETEYNYGWFRLNPQTHGIVQRLKSGIVSGKEIDDILPANIFGVGEHSIIIVLYDVFGPHKHLKSSPIAIHIKGRKALKPGPERKMLQAGTPPLPSEADPMNIENLRPSGEPPALDVKLHPVYKHTPPTIERPISDYKLSVKITKPRPNSEFRIGDYMYNLEAVVEGPDGKVVNNNKMSFDWSVVGYLKNGSTKDVLLHRSSFGVSSVAQSSERIPTDLFTPGNAKLKVRLYTTKEVPGGADTILVGEDEIDIVLK